jgi:hypothetical protein
MSAVSPPDGTYPPRMVGEEHRSPLQRSGRATLRVSVAERSSDSADVKQSNPGEKFITNAFNSIMRRKLG